MAASRIQKVDLSTKRDPVDLCTKIPPTCETLTRSANPRRWQAAATAPGSWTLVWMLTTWDMKGGPPLGRSCGVRSWLWSPDPVPNGAGILAGVRIAVESRAQSVDFRDTEGRDRVVEVVGGDGAFVLVVGQILLPVTQGGENRGQLAGGELEPHGLLLPTWV